MPRQRQGRTNSFLPGEPARPAEFEEQAGLLGVKANAAREVPVV